MKFEKITYAGHSAVLISSKDLIIAVDPWLSGNPKCPAALKNPKKLDLIILTHGHSDHASDAPALAKATGASVLATWELAMLMIKEGVPQERVIPMNKGGSVAWKGVDISLTHAMHSSSFDTAEGAVYAGEPCGVIVSDGVNSIYHAGDTALFSDMNLIGETYRPNIALLPIGDRFTMGPKQAAKATAWIGCKVAIPIHYATFDLLTGTAEQFVSECKDLEVRVQVLKPGESHSL